MAKTQKKQQQRPQHVAASSAASVAIAAADAGRLATLDARLSTSVTPLASVASLTPLTGRPYFHLVTRRQHSDTKH